MQAGLKSAYAAPAPDDGIRILVDRLWPRGISREQLQIAVWMKELAPSNELRRWFGHDPVKWEEFRQRYFTELAGREAAVAELVDKIAGNQVTLVFAARDRQHNNAVALRDYLQTRLDPAGQPGKEKS